MHLHEIEQLVNDGHRVRLQVSRLYFYRPDHGDDVLDPPTPYPHMIDGEVLSATRDQVVLMTNRGELTLSTAPSGTEDGAHYSKTSWTHVSHIIYVDGQAIA